MIAKEKIKMTNKEFVPFSEEDFSAALDAAKCAGVLDQTKDLVFVIDEEQQRLLRDKDNNPFNYHGLSVCYSFTDPVPNGEIALRVSGDEEIFRWVRPSESESVVELPRYFRPHTARMLLENPKPFLVEALCIWDDSIQQYDFWLAEYERVSLGEPLSHNAVMAIEGWLEVWESQNPNGDNYKFKENTMSLPDRFNPEYARESLERPTYESIDRMCVWNDTPQKFWFWWNEAVKTKDGRTLSEEACMAIRGWLEVWEEQNQKTEEYVPFTADDFDAALDAATRAGVLDQTKDLVFVVKLEQQRLLRDSNNDLDHFPKHRGLPVCFSFNNSIPDGIITIKRRGGKEIFRWVRPSPGEPVLCDEKPEPPPDDPPQKTTYTAKFVFRGDGGDEGLPVFGETIQIPDPLESDGWKKGEKVVCNWPPKHVRDTGYGGFILDGDCKDFPINHENGLLWWGDYYERFDDEIPTADALCISYTEWTREVKYEIQEKTVNKDLIGPTWWPDGNHVSGPMKG
jgi:hypothetical protein